VVQSPPRQRPEAHCAGAIGRCGWRGRPNLRRTYREGDQRRGEVHSESECLGSFRFWWCGPLVVTGSICYDATDIALASDLKGRSDIYLISALNRDVGTFDRMTEALHYHRRMS
jgi:hypothetical protein